jgi:dienelactone hydrolase
MTREPDHSPDPPPFGRPSTPIPLQGFDELSFAHGGFGHRVYRGGDAGPGVCLLHELTGLSENAVEFARRLIRNDLRVYLPMFFGRPAQSSLLGPVRLFCLRREFTLFASDQTSPVADWLRALCARVHLDSGGQGVGIVGMCFTGGVVLATTIQPQVRAVVSAQPALPFPLLPAARRNLGLSPGDLDDARRSDTPILALRFKHDLISPKARMNALRETLPTTQTIEVPQAGNYDDYRPRIPCYAHSVLTGNLVDRPDHPTRKALDAVISFLRQHLL